jgi:hypothetical protein
VNQFCYSSNNYTTTPRKQSTEMPKRNVILEGKVIAEEKRKEREGSE